MRKTISFHNGSEWSRGHNVRDKRFVKEQHHIDKSLSENNVILVDELIRKAYDRIFGEAVAEYNAKQKRSDRRIDNYYNKIKNDKKKHIVYECIVQMAYADHGFIFANAIGMPFDQRTYADHFNRIVAAARIEKVIQLGTNDVSVGFHTLRHTFATRAVENGMDILVLSRILGHSSPTTTLNKYGHVLHEHMKNSMEKIRPVNPKDNED